MRSAGWMQWGFKEMMDIIEAEHENYKEVVIVSTYLHYQPYIFALFHAKHDPAQWQADKVLPWKIKTRHRQLQEADYKPDVLYVLVPPPRILPINLQVLKTVPWYQSRVGSRAAFGFYRLSQGRR